MGIDRYFRDVRSNNFLFEVGAGRTNPNHHVGVFKFGENDGVPALGATIWDGEAVSATDSLPYLADGVEQTFTLQSDDANDAYPSGSGARIVRMFGLTASGLWQVEDVQLNGLTPVSTVGKYWRIFRMYVLEAGGRSGAAGNITVEYSGTIYAAIVMKTGYVNNQTLMAAFTIPLGYSGVLIDGHVHAADKAVTFSMVQRPFGGAERVQRRASSVLQDDAHWDWKVPIRYSELTDLEIRGNAISPPASSTSADFTLVLFKTNLNVPDITNDPTIGV